MLSIRPLDAAFGAEVTGIDLAEPIGENEADALRQAFLCHIVLVIRNQDLTAKQYRDGISLFGDDDDDRASRPQ